MVDTTDWGVEPSLRLSITGSVASDLSGNVIPVVVLDKSACIRSFFAFEHIPVKVIAMEIMKLVFKTKRKKKTYSSAVCISQVNEMS
jgi:hypothetical protein